MLIRPRVMAVCAALCVLAPMTLASAAQAHRGARHLHRHDVFQSKQVSGVCAQAGVAVSDHVHAFKRLDEVQDPGVSSLSETQTKELVAACEKLAGAFAVKHKAVEGASKTFWEALKADRTKLQEACPALTEHHEHGFWEQTELSPACQEALKSYWASAHEAGKAYRTAVQEACKTFHAALTEFEEATKAIVAAIEAGESEHHFQPAPGPGGPELPGTGPVGPGHAGPGYTGSGHGGPGSEGSGPHGYGRG